MHPDCDNVEEKLKYLKDNGVKGIKIHPDYQEAYIDDERYCKAYANDKLRYNHWGRFKIRQMLQFQGLASEHIRAGLESINDDEYKKILTEIILSKIRSLKDTEPYTRYAKVMRHATSKGFESDAIAKLLSECGENAQNE